MSASDATLYSTGRCGYVAQGTVCAVEGGEGRGVGGSKCSWGDGGSGEPAWGTFTLGYLALNPAVGDF